MAAARCWRLQGGAASSLRGERGACGDSRAGRRVSAAASGLARGQAASSAATARTRHTPTPILPATAMEHFIKTIKKYPCLWNTTAIEYRDQELKDAAWGEVRKETDLGSGESNTQLTEPVAMYCSCMLYVFCLCLCSEGSEAVSARGRRVGFTNAPGHCRAGRRGAQPFSNSRFSLASAINNACENRMNISHSLHHLPR